MHMTAPPHPSPPSRSRYADGLPIDDDQEIMTHAQSVMMSDSTVEGCRRRSFGGRSVALHKRK